MGNRERTRRASAGLMVVLSLAMVSAGSAAAAQPLRGELDRSFGQGGKVVARFASTLGNSTVSSMVRQPDGSLVLAGSTDTYAKGSIEYVGYVERRTASGALDPGFGDGGIAHFNKEGLLALQPDGGILLGISGEEHPFGAGSTLYGLGPDGRLDSTFGSAGTSGASSLVRAVAVDSEGRIIVAGLSHFEFSERNYGLTVERLLPDGKLDESFGAKGIVKLANNDSARGLAIREDGAILVLAAGRLFALTSGGALDTSFGDGGQVVLHGNPLVLVALPGGDAVVGGSTERYCCRPSHFILDRYRSDGSPDPGFGSNGSASFAVRDVDSPTALAAAPDGEVVLAGSTAASSSCGRISCVTTPIVARISATDALDPGFGSAGRVDLPLPSGTPGIEFEPRIEGLAVAPSGEILAAGDSGRSSDAVVLALRPSGAPDLGFGNAGVVDEVHPLPSSSFASELAVGPGGHLALSAYSDAGSHISRDILLSAGPNGNLEEGIDSGARFGVPEGEGELHSDDWGRFYSVTTRGLKHRVFSQVSRFDTRGNRDQRYGVQGTARLPAHFNVRSVVGRKNGEALFLGRFAGRFEIAVCELDARGRPDRHFGRRGLAVFDLDRKSDAQSATLDDRGRLVIFGQIGADAAALRLLPNGKLDPSFGQHGRLTHLPLDTKGWSRLDASPAGIAIATVPDDSGSRPPSTTLLRLRPDGRRDRAFGRRGVRRVKVRGRVVPLVSGRRLILISGSSPKYESGIALRAFRPDGALDRRFGRRGVLIAGSRYLNVASAVRQPDGRIVIAATKGVSEEVGSTVELLRVR